MSIQIQHNQRLDLDGYAAGQPRCYFAHAGATMFDWLKRIFGRSDDDERQRFFDMLDALNADGKGGAPTTIERQLGTLKIRCGVLAFGDPQDVPSLELPNIDTDE